MITKPSQSVTVFVKDLNANDRFVVPGHDTIYVVESRQNSQNVTRVVYRVPGTDSVNVFTKPSLSTAYLLTD